MTTFVPVNEPFLKYLNVHKTPHLLLTAETDDFDDVTLREWSDEGFEVTYVPLGNGGSEYVRRLHSIADKIVGVSETYAIVGATFPRKRTRRKGVRREGFFDQVRDMIG